MTFRVSLELATSVKSFPVGSCFGSKLGPRLSPLVIPSSVGRLITPRLVENDIVSDCLLILLMLVTAHSFQESHSSPKPLGIKVEYFFLEGYNTAFGGSSNHFWRSTEAYCRRYANVKWSISNSMGCHHLLDKLPFPLFTLEPIIWKIAFKKWKKASYVFPKAALKHCYWKK